MTTPPTPLGVMESTSGTPSTIPEEDAGSKTHEYNYHHSQQQHQQQQQQQQQLLHLNRACESCRVLKVRCLSDDPSPTASCHRCTKAGRTCVFAPPQRRKPRKRTDARVAELEREVRAMRLMLAESRAAATATSDSPGQTSSNHDDAATGAFNSGRNSRPSSSTAQGVGSNSLDADNHADLEAHDESVSFPNSISGQRQNLASDPWLPPGDVVDRGIVTLEQSEELVDFYRRNLSEQYPGVSVADDVSSQELRETKPVLWLSILAAAVLSIDAQLSAILNQEVIRTLASYVFIRGEKSLDLIAALHIAVLFYYPPESTSRLLFYQYSNLAAGMVIELGLSSKPAVVIYPENQGENFLDHSITADLLERAQVLLSCYVFTSGLGIRLRRPSILPYNNWIEECISILSESSEIFNQQTAAWVKLNRIAEETVFFFGLDDASTTVEMSEIRLQAVLKGFERKMNNWLRETKPELLRTQLLIDYYSNSITVYEFVMDGGRHDPSEFKRRHFTLPPLDDSSTVHSQTPLSSVQVDATVKAIVTVQNMLDEILKLSVEQLRASSNIPYIRALYGVVFLLRLRVQVSTTSLGDYVELESLKIDFYMQALEKQITAAAGPQHFRIPSHWLKTLTTRAKPWYQKLVQRTSSTGGNNTTADKTQDAKPINTNTMPSNADGIQEADRTSVPNQHHPLLPPPLVSSPIGFEFSNGFGNLWPHGNFPSGYAPFPLDTIMGVDPLQTSFYSAPSRYAETYPTATPTSSTVTSAVTAGGFDYPMDAVAETDFTGQQQQQQQQSANESSGAGSFDIWARQAGFANQQFP